MSGEPLQMAFCGRHAARANKDGVVGGLPARITFGCGLQAGNVRGLSHYPDRDG